jgi:hypothetical protein
VGHSIVFLSADGRTQRFIPGSADCEGITATALSPNRKLLAVAEKADKAVISIYDTQTLRRRKVLQTADVGSKVSTPDMIRTLQQIACPNTGYVSEHTSVCEADSLHQLTKSQSHGALAWC